MVVDILQLFDRQVGMNPALPAVHSDGTLLSYAQLAQLSAQLTERLTRQGICSGSVVAINIQRSSNLVAALIGVLRIGAICLPIDPSYPAERVQYMMSESGAEVLLAGDKTQVDLKPLPAPGSTAPETHSNAAYILYTSGSTGTPKGVAMNRSSLSRLINWQVRSDGECAKLPAAQYAPITFDVSFQEILATLGGGGCLVVVPQEVRRDPAATIEFLREHHIGRISLPTAVFQPIASRGEVAPPLPSLRHVYVGGEQLRVTPQVRRWFSQMPECTLHNHYGPTEAHVVTVFSMAGNPDGWPDLPPIGKPLPHVELHLLDESRTRVPSDQIGEIYIGGECLANGYVNKPELTAERFVSSGGQRLYRTGDLAQIIDGSYVYKGRIDDVVKIDGYQIETAEVQAVLSNHPDVEDSIVVADRDLNGRPRLAAYVVSRNDHENNDKTVRREFFPPWRDYLAARLPTYMIPTVWVRLSSLPTTPNGKADRNALPPVPSGRPPVGSSWARPRTAAEKSLNSIWEDALQLRDLGIDDNFFDLGGTSLLLATVAQRVQERMKIEVPLAEFYRNSTIRELAIALAAKSSSTIDQQARAIPQIRPSTPRSYAEDSVAVVGMACRFPGASDPGTFWNNLIGGVESITFFGGLAKQSDNGTVAAAGVLEDVELFDAGFFGLPPDQAKLLDPQHRLFLECSWEALEDAACMPQGFLGRIGVFGGTGPSTYLLNNLHSAQWRPDRTLLDSASEVALLLGTDKDFLTSRVSYLLDLQGPSVNINAACATSLLAIHYARRALLDGDCELALAGAACVPTPQLSGYIYEQSMPFSPDGHCRPFEERAAGTVFGSGVGVVALKRLSDAIAAGDDIYAVIKGSAVNNDGARKVGIAAPSEEGQANVIKEALTSAGIESGSVSYVEAHGTATPVGDHIEVAALTRAFGSERKQWCGLGSVKSNVGHLGWAAGMAGFLKAVLSLRHGRIPATLHYQRANPLFELEKTPFFVVSEAIDFPATEGPRRVGVSAFGLGGANAHVILEEAPAKPMRDDLSRRWHIVPVSARNENALAGLVNRYIEYLAADSNADLAEIAATTTLGRRHYEVRQAFVADTREALLKQLHKFESTPFHPNSLRIGRKADRLVGLFGGYGTEYLGMGQDLYEREPIFRQALTSFDSLLRDELGVSIADILYRRGPRGGDLTEIVEVHAAIFLVQLALARLWESIGVTFDIVLGHSLGEYAAACAAGVFSDEDGLRLVIARGRAISQLPADGSMALVTMDEATARSALESWGHQVDIAALNSPSHTTISGSSVEVAKACADFASHGHEVKPLPALRAAHSRLMEPAMDEVEAAFEKIRLQPPQIELISNLTGDVVTSEVCTPGYWRRQLRETVRFCDGVRTALRIGAGPFVELSGNPVLLALARSVLSEHDGPWIASLRRRKKDDYNFAAGIAEIYSAGIDIDWPAVTGNRSGRAHLPPYPFQRQRLWTNASGSGNGLRAAGKTSPVADPGWREMAYQVRWESLGFAATLPETSMSGRWLVMGDPRSGLGQALITEMRRRGARCVLAIPGSRFEWLGDSRLTLDASNEEQVQMLFRSIGADLAGLVHLQGICTPEPTIDASFDIVNSLRPSLVSLLGAVKGTIVGPDAIAPRLWLLTEGAHRVIATDAVKATQTSLWGMGRVISLEYPDLKCRRLDISTLEPADPSLIVNCLNSDTNEHELALRSGELYSARLTRYEDARLKPTILRSDASYLLVGGLGGLGLWAAKQLLARGARHLILAGRTSPSPDAQRAIEDLRESGAVIEVETLDAAERHQVDSFFDRIQASAQPLAGLLHCAGVLDDALLPDLNWKRFEAVLRPKVQGSWNLHAAALEKGISLDFFVMYSSGTAILGNYGQGNYAAANAFMDGLAHERQSSGLNGTSINWGLWSEIGGAATRPEFFSKLKSRGMGQISPQSGADALTHLLAGPSAQVAVLPNVWDDFLPAHDLVDSPFFSLLNHSEGVRHLPANLYETLAESTPERRPEILRAHLLSAIGKLCGSDLPIDENATLSSLGLDSLSLIQLRNGLKNDLRCLLPAKLLTEFPTVRLLADHLLAHVVRFDQSVVREAKSAVTPRSSVSKPESNGHLIGLSIQQKRWLKLIRQARYGQRVVPVFFYAAFDAKAFRAALETVVSRHDLLRYKYTYDHAELLAMENVIPADEDLFHDLRALSEIDQAEAIATHVSWLRANHPDPFERVSWNLRCLRLAHDRFLVLVGAQHLEFDGSGLSVFLSELRDAYRGTAAIGPAPELSDAVQYNEYTKAQNAYLRDDLENDRSFFEGLFSAVTVRTTLPGFDITPNTTAYESRRFTPTKPLALWSHVQAFAAQHAVSPFAVLLSSYAALLARITDRQDITLSIIRSGRVDERFARAIGPFTMPVPVPVFVGNRSPEELVQQCDRMLTQVISRANYPSTDLIRTATIFQDRPFDTYFCDAAINFLSYRREEQFGEPRIEVVEVLGDVRQPEFASCDFGLLRRIPGFHLVASVDGDLLTANYWYHVHRFDEAQVAAWAAEHSNIIKKLLGVGVAGQPATPSRERIYS